MTKILIGFIFFLKFYLPLLYLVYPFQASWVNFVLDTTDGDILIPLGLDPDNYQIWDKGADFITYLMMFLAGFALKWEIRRTILYLFIFRSIGQVLFFITGSDRVFFFFPNFLEPLFMVYSLLRFIDERRAYARYKRYLLPIWFVIISYKMWNEWNIHLAQIDLSEYLFGQ